MSTKPYSLYLHIPFCRHRCAYCDFNTYAGLDTLIPAYTRALCAEISWLSKAAAERLPLHTIFLGGGTPSLLPVAALEAILHAAEDHFFWQADIEITLEANPGTLSPDYLRAIRSLGINRLSLGMQSSHPEELHFLEREHDFVDVIEAVKWARLAGFDNLSLDLIYGLPGQSLISWETSLKRALDLHPEHLSLYALSLEHGTPMGRWAKRGLISAPDSDLAADMYELASERLSSSGYQQYEISNWASHRNGQVLMCRHNLQYWRNLPYLGLGAGAHGFVAGHRTINVRAPTAYIQRLSAATGNNLPFPRTPATSEARPIDRLTEMRETMMMGLRLTQEGVVEAAFRHRFRTSLRKAFGDEIEALVNVGLLEWSQEAIRLTKRGRLLGNQVFMAFV